MATRIKRMFDLEKFLVTFIIDETETLIFDLNLLVETMIKQLIGHGAIQKLGDECAGLTKDGSTQMIVDALNGMWARLLDNDWKSKRETDKISAKTGREQLSNEIYDPNDFLIFVTGMSKSPLTAKMIPTSVKFNITPDNDVIEFLQLKHILWTLVE